MNDKPLTSDQKEIAAAIWEDLMSARDANTLAQARRKLETLSPEVQFAISMAIVQFWQENEFPESEESRTDRRVFRVRDGFNPFR